MTDLGSFMDARTKMIIANGKPISSDVVCCHFDGCAKKWDITFKNGKTYHYSKWKVTVLKESKSLNPKSYQVRYKGKFLSNITAINSFRDGRVGYWHICFLNGYEQDYIVDELEVRKSVLDHDRAKQVFDYLREVAGYIGTSDWPDDNSVFLLKQYEKIDFLGGDTAAAVYLNPEEFDAGTKLDSSAPVFPFGCNESQYQAVVNALSNRISVIEGPPGTGKTQTILNIIANLILQGKTVQVVSNNNSAIDNVMEKLASSKYKLDFMVAQLGRDERKSAFIAAQTGAYPDMSDWKSAENASSEFSDSIREKSVALQEIFREKNRLAKLREERNRVQLECEHLHALIQDNELILSSKNLSSDQLMEFWQEYQDIQDGTKKAGLIYRLMRRISLGIRVGKLLKEDTAGVINKLQYIFYETRLKEIDTEISDITVKFENDDADARMDELIELSLCCFRSRLAERYSDKNSRRVFVKDDLWQHPEEFIKEYPVVLSTTYTARSSLGRQAQFDYVVMDEASQVDVATVHKFQGREKNDIILSTVDDTITEFSDDPNLLNVAISRAKKQLILVVADQEQPAGSNIADLIGYIRYNNCDVQHSKISSVFDYLYSQYTESRLEYLKRHKRISEYDSENLMYALIQDELKNCGNVALGVVCHQPLQLLFRDCSRMNAEEQRFVNTGLSHIDFLIFNKVSKEPMLAIEVDGFHYHKDGTKQAERDKLKNHILEVYGLPLVRFSTNGSGEKEKLREKIAEITA